MGSFHCNIQSKSFEKPSLITGLLAQSLIGWFKSFDLPVETIVLARTTSSESITWIRDGGNQLLAILLCTQHLNLIVEMNSIDYCCCVSIIASGHSW